MANNDNIIYARFNHGHEITNQYIVWNRQMVIK